MPFVQYGKGDSWGYVAFDKALTEEDVAYVKEKLGTLSSKPVTWSFLDGAFAPPILSSHIRSNLLSFYQRRQKRPSRSSARPPRRSVRCTSRRTAAAAEDARVVVLVVQQK